MKHGTAPGSLKVRPLELSRRVGRALAARQLLLVTAESCTGGLVAEWITRVPGSSGWFDRGLVTYSNAAKTELLDVKPATLKRYGAVSEQTASEMAAGALQNSRADLAVAITGIAGPEGGTPDKPVGTVCLAWADRTGDIVSVRLLLNGDRRLIRRDTAVLALLGVLDRIKDETG